MATGSTPPAAPRSTVIDPSSGKVVSQFVDATDADVDRAVAAARRAFDDGRWSDLPPMVREGIMHKLADMLDAHADELAELEAIDNGKPKGMAAAIDVPGAIGMIHYMAGWATKLGGESRSSPLATPRGAVPQLCPPRADRRRRADRAVELPAAHGRAQDRARRWPPAAPVVLKPAEQTSLTALRLADLIQQAGIPAGVVNIITGNGHTAGDRLVRHPDVDKVAFTGSTEVGKIINRTATDSLKRVTLELGGKSPVIVLPGRRPSRWPAPGTARAIFFNSGQVCVAGSRLYAHKSVFDQVLENFVEASRLLAAARQPRSRRPHGPAGLRRAVHERVMGYIEARQEGGGAGVADGRRQARRARAAITSTRPCWST